MREYMRPARSRSRRKEWNSSPRQRVHRPGHRDGSGASPLRQLAAVHLRQVELHLAVRRRGRAGRPRRAPLRSSTPRCRGRWPRAGPPGACRTAFAMAAMAAGRDAPPPCRAIPRARPLRRGGARRPGASGCSRPSSPPPRGPGVFSSSASPSPRQPARPFGGHAHRGMHLLERGRRRRHGGEARAEAVHQPRRERSSGGTR